MARGVWVLLKHDKGHWAFQDVFSDVVEAQKQAPSYWEKSNVTFRWDNAPFSSIGFAGAATVPAFKIILKAVK